MFQPRRILLPTDLSELSLSAFPYAVRLAERFGSTIELLYADPFADPIDLVGGSFTGTDPERIDSMKSLAEKTIAGHADELLPDGLARTITVEVDAPYLSIVRRAKDVDLVVMGTHGRSGWRRALLGSVTETVLRETDTPVLTVRDGDSLEKGVTGFSRIVCPVNFTEMARKAVDVAVALGRVFDSEILVVHVAENLTTAQDDEARLDDWIPAEVVERVSHRRLVLKGDPAEEVVDLAGREGADLIVVGAQHKRFSDTTVIGVTTERITRHSPCPVLTVHSVEDDPSLSEEA